MLSTETLKPTQLNHPTRNPSLKRFVYKPRPYINHFELKRQIRADQTSYTVRSNQFIVSYSLRAAPVMQLVSDRESKEINQ